jgi:hypothetical protein
VSGDLEKPGEIGNLEQVGGGHSGGFGGLRGGELCEGIGQTNEFGKGLKSRVGAKDSRDREIG